MKVEILEHPEWFKNKSNLVEAIVLIGQIQAFLTQMGITSCDVANEIDAMLEDEATYYMASYQKILNSLAAKGNEIMSLLTQSTNCTLITPMALQFQITSTLKDFINSTLGNVIVFLGILLATLMYSLMLQDVTQKTYEFGMLRALGFKNSNLVGVISLKSLCFSFMGLCIGLLVAMVANVLMKELIFVKAKNVLSYDLSAVAVLLGTLFGFITPFVSNYWPIKASLAKNLRDSLDLSRNK